MAPGGDMSAEALRCKKCGGLILQQDIDKKREIENRLGRPNGGPPQVCMPCVWEVLCRMADEEEEEP